MKTICITILATILSTFAFAQNKSPQAEALKQLNKLKPGLEKKYKGTMAEPKAVVGDINGDNQQDCVLSYVFTPKGGGNMIVGHQSTIFLNTGKGMRDAGNIPDPGFCYTPQSITNGQIIVSVYTCAPPYNDDLGTAKFVYKKGKVSLVK